MKDVEVMTHIHADDLAAIVEQHREFMTLTDYGWMDEASSLQDRAYALGRARGRADQALPAEQHQVDPVAVDWEEVRQSADRYLWLRNHAVRIQGSQMWYQGAALDIRVDVGRDHMAEQAKSVQEGGGLLLRHQPE